MKKLIDLTLVNKMKEEGKTIICVDENTLLTPSARDAIEENQMTIQETHTLQAPETTISASCCTEHIQDTKNKDRVSADLIFQVLSRMQENGMLKGILDSCQTPCQSYQAEYDSAGFKLIRGNTIHTEMLETGNPAQNGKVNYQQIIGPEDGSAISAGVITIDNVNFDWQTECQEIYYIVSGCITVTIDGTVYEALPGDAFFIKKGLKCAFGAKGLGKAFYATY